MSIHAPSFSNSVSSSSYAGSAADEASDENEMDLIALLTERLSSAFDPIPLDRSLAVQAQTYVSKSHSFQILLNFQMVIIYHITLCYRVLN